MELGDAAVRSGRGAWGAMDLFGQAASAKGWSFCSTCTRGADDPGRDVTQGGIVVNLVGNAPQVHRQGEVESRGAAAEGSAQPGPPGSGEPSRRSA